MLSIAEQLKVSMHFYFGCLYRVKVFSSCFLWLLSSTIPILSLFYFLPLPIDHHCFWYISSCILLMWPYQLNHSSSLSRFMSFVTFIISLILVILILSIQFFLEAVLQNSISVAVNLACSLLFIDHILLWSQNWFVC